jgi:hypothetical protein
VNSGKFEEEFKKKLDKWDYSAVVYLCVYTLKACMHAPETQKLNKVITGSWQGSIRRAVRLRRFVAGVIGSIGGAQRR